MNRLLANANDLKEYLEEYEQDKFSNEMDVLVIDCKNLAKWKIDVARELLEKPDAYLAELKKSTLNFFTKEINVLVKNSPINIQLQDLRSEYLGKLITIHGIVSKTAPPRPTIYEAQYECRKCGAKHTRIQNEWFLIPPDKCGTGRKGCQSRQFRLLEDPRFTKYMDVQSISIQEKPEELEVGQPPRIIDLEIMHPSLINSAQAGDILSITGIPRTRPPRNPKKRKWITYVDVIYIDKRNEDPTNVKINEEEKQEIQWLASDKTVYSKIVGSIAPSIYGYERIKESIMYQLFGGCEKEYPDRTSRGNIHILWIDDPSTAKSQVLLAAKNISARGLYVSGGGASGAGLTATVVKVDEAWTLEAGAMVLANGGICCIDEIEKMNAEDRKRIHEAMSIQTVNIQKATVHYTLPAKTAILAAGNPAFGRYDSNRPVAENITLLPSILSRFDLIFIGKGDKPDTDRDESIATYVLENPEMYQAEIPKETLRKYIAYARRIKPKMSPKAIAHIKAFYTEMRNMYNTIESQKSPIVITARQLEGLRRISEAHARIRLSTTVDEEDALAAINIMKVSLKQAGIDPSTGKYDIDAIMGTPKTIRDKMVIIMDLFKEHKTMTREEIYLEMEKVGVPKEETSKIIHKLISDSTIYEQSIGVYRKI